jgi:hypothetical protein
MDVHHLRTVLWRGPVEFSAERFVLDRQEASWRLCGTVVLAFGDAPAEVRYRVKCDAGWVTRDVLVELRVGEEEHGVRLTVDDRRWRVDGVERPDIRGCVDVDLSVTPATNTLPIRRLSLPIGDGADVTAAWVRFPDLTIEPLPQRYTRVAERRYRYESEGGFSAELDVDDLGLVTRYAGGWERVAAR